MLPGLQFSTRQARIPLESRRSSTPLRAAVALTASDTGRRQYIQYTATSDISFAMESVSYASVRASRQRLINDAALKRFACVRGFACVIECWYDFWCLGASRQVLSDTIVF